MRETETGEGIERQRKGDRERELNTEKERAMHIPFLQTLLLK